MFVYFLLEDMSSEVLIDILMENVSLRYSGVSYKCRSFKGLGGFTQKNTVKETRTGKLLNDLSTYLRGFNNSLKYLPDSAVFIVLDNDDNDPAVFRAGLEEVAKDNHITIDYVFCLAVEEMEAWLLGDREALQQAYPAAKMQKLKDYEQDSICGTWEMLADIVYPKGIKQFKKDFPTYMEVGQKKSEWAKRIGRYMEPERNISPSFQSFWKELTKRAVS